MPAKTSIKQELAMIKERNLVLEAEQVANDKPVRDLQDIVFSQTNKTSSFNLCFARSLKLFFTLLRQKLEKDEIILAVDNKDDLFEDWSEGESKPAQFIHPKSSSSNINPLTDSWISSRSP